MSQNLYYFCSLFSSQILCYASNKWKIILKIHLFMFYSCGFIDFFEYYLLLKRRLKNKTKPNRKKKKEGNNKPQTNKTQQTKSPAPRFLAHKNLKRTQSWTRHKNKGWDVNAWRKWPGFSWQVANKISSRREEIPSDIRCLNSDRASLSLLVWEGWSLLRIAVIQEGSSSVSPLFIDCSWITKWCKLEIP